ncbi:MAG: conjugal transfer protein TraF [Elusimicrobia bacterium]|nr:conjugal transfer protein TraF [Elusimicrobiota bacterium]
MKLRNIVFIFTILAFGASSVFAEQWQILGTRPMGMGGAFVGMAKGPIAQYWNPAGLYKDNNTSGLEIPVGIGVELTGDIMENASKIGELADDFSSIQAAQTGGTAVDAKEIAAFVKTLALMSDMNDPGNGALFEIAGGVNLKLSKIAVSINNFTAAGVTPFIDTVNVGLDSGAGGINMGASTTTIVGMDSTQRAAATTMASAIDVIGFSDLENLMCGSAGCLNTQSSITTPAELANALIQQDLAVTGAALTEAANAMLEYATEAAPIIDAVAGGKDYTNNNSNLTVEGAAFTEIAFGMAKPIWIDGLLIGGNIKMVNGRVGYSTFQFMQEESGTTDAFDDFDSNTEDSWKPALDLGFLMQLNKRWANLPMNPRVGLVIRNLNAPKFDKPTTAVAAGKGSSYQLDRQMRMGFAISPANFWHLALDMDLTKNDTPVDGFKSRQLSMGTEINIFNKSWINIPLRAGMIKNMAESDSKMSYTAGLGFNLIHFNVDVTGMMSSDTTEIEGDDVPRKLSGAVSIGLLF